MKRGFEENVPKVRPRVRLGRALDEQVAEAQQLAADESAETSAPLAPVAEPATLPPAEREPAPVHDLSAAAETRPQ